MKHLNKDLSKKLSDKGIVSESYDDYCPECKDWARVGCSIERHNYYRVSTYTIWDLIRNKENAKKIWGEKKVYTDVNGSLITHKEEQDYFDCPSSWHYYSHMLLDLVQIYGEDSLEVIKEIERSLN